MVDPQKSHRIQDPVQNIHISPEVPQHEYCLGSTLRTLVSPLSAIRSNQKNKTTMMNAHHAFLSRRQQTLQ